jgi:hypothetical protein
MSDDEIPFYAPHQPPVAPRQPKPGDLVWEFVRARDHKRFRCELRGHGEYGWEAQIFDDLDHFISRRFPTRALAIAWAESEREALAK